jgi:hypothetical protein
MNVSLSGMDKEINQLERRIADDRAAFVAALSDCGHGVRETVSSPKALLAVAAVGFVAGKLLFRPSAKAAHRQEPPSKLGGALGVLAAGLSLLQPGYGAGGIARWAAQQFWDRRKNRKQASVSPAVPTGPRGSPAGEMPQVRMPPRMRSSAEEEKRRAAGLR